MNVNNSLSSHHVTEDQASDNIVVQISANILYQLLQSVPIQQTSLVDLSSSKSEVIIPKFNNSDHGSPVISVGIDDLDQINQTSVPINVDTIIHKNDINSSLFSKNETHFLEKYGSLSTNDSIKLNPKKRLLQRHLLEKGCEEITNISDNGSETASRYSANNDAPFGRGKNGKPLTRTPFIPSYMDPKSGPFLCKVCGYKASGLHYRVMACEGCKGFFRRSVQKKLSYVCKMNNNCKINSDNRTKCQQCRWLLCLDAGMDIASVLNEEERQSKNDLIKANRQKRNQANQGSYIVSNVSNTSRSSFESVDLKEKSQSDRIKAILETIDIITKAYERAFIKDGEIMEKNPIITGYQVGQEITNRVTIFAKLLPGMDKLSPVSQNTLLQNRCLDIICLWTAFTFNNQTQQMKLPSGRFIDAKFVDRYKHLEPLWNFGKRTAEYNLRVSEMAVLTGLAFLVNNNLESLDGLYNQLLAALDHLMAGQSLRNSKLLIVIFSDLQVLTTRLFELRAPIGQQLLFDIDYAVSMPVAPLPPSSSIQGNYVINENGRAYNVSPKVPITKAATSTSSSIFAFSYGDRQL